MDGSEKRRDSAAQTAAILADMGIQVWFERARQAPAADAPASAPEERPVKEVQTARDVQPVQEPRPVAASSPPAAQVPLPETVAVAPPPVQSSSAAPSSEIIEFSWLKNSHALIAYPLGVDVTAARMLKDILAYASWLSDPAGKQASGRYASGDFRWPQLVDSGGNPLRALRAFLDKHFAAQPARVLVTADVAPMLDKWLVELVNETSLAVVELPALQDGIGDPASKKQIWQMMRSAR